jgi:AcrR family transcriptional regulator
MDQLSPRQEALDRDAVLEAAIALTEDVGLDRVTIKALAHRLGVWPTTVKHHLGDIDDIKDAVADELAGRIPVPAVATDPWEWLRAFAGDTRLHIRRYAGVSRRIQQRGATSPQQIRVIDTVMSVLLDAGLNDRDAALAYGLLINWIVDFAEVEAFRTRDPEGAAAMRERMTRLGRDQAFLLPGFGAAAVAWSALDVDDYFAFALDALLTGIRALAVTEPTTRTGSTS